jgi:CHASE2 domain-containing sensor protein
LVRAQAQVALQGPVRAEEMARPLTLLLLALLLLALGLLALGLLALFLLALGPLAPWLLALVSLGSPTPQARQGQRHGELCRQRRARQVAAASTLRR